MRSVYLDNAATSWPKPRTVPRAMARAITRGGGNPGRSGHAKAVEAGRTVLKTRELLAELFNIKDPAKIVFTKNATEALNTVLFGLLKAGDRVVTTSMEHNSVLRPLNALSTAGVVIDVSRANGDGLVNPEEIASRLMPGTRLVVVTHASNVTGTVNDIARIGRLCRDRGVLFLVDAAQTAGCLPIDAEQVPFDYLAFSGHKGLLGPQGTGGLYIRDEANLAPLTRGGTGSLSDREEQPGFLPDRFESGTLNVPGIAGLGEGVAHILRTGVERISTHDRRLREIFLSEISRTQKVTVHGNGGAPHTGVVSISIEGLTPSRAGELLENGYGILTRIGLHCAPQAHRTIGTFPDGTVRLSWGLFTTECDIAAAACAVEKIAARV